MAKSQVLKKQNPCATSAQGNQMLGYRAALLKTVTTFHVGSQHPLFIFLLVAATEGMTKVQEMKGVTDYGNVVQLRGLVCVHVCMCACVCLHVCVCTCVCMRECVGTTSLHEEVTPHT